MTHPANHPGSNGDPDRGPGTIQPHGAMLVCEPGSNAVLFASRNLADLTGYDGKPIPGALLEDILGAKPAHDLRNAAAKAGSSGVPGVLLGVQFSRGNGTFDVAAHIHQGKMLIEIEPCQDGGASVTQALDLTRSLIQRIGREKGVEAIAQTGARLLRALLDYDRVVVCRFLHNGAGRIIAEAKASGLNAYLGQHLPASDFPASVRQAHLANPVTMIPDVGYEPVPLEPADGGPVDTSCAQLRSVPAEYRHYLRAMGAAASLSLSIIVEGELWGVISCHHKSPKVLPMPLRLGAELFAQYFALQIAVAERRASILAARRARAQLDSIITGVNAGGAAVQGMVDRLHDLAALIGSDGAGLWVDGVWTASGDALDRNAASALLEFIATQAPSAVWSTQELRSHLPDTTTSVAGVLAIPLSTGSQTYLLLFRNEEAHGVERIEEVAEGAGAVSRFSPGGSFDNWREEVRGRSLPWSDDELAAAVAIGAYLRDILLRQNEVSPEERARVEQRRRILNDELNHRVKNIIALVKSIAMQTGARAASVEEYSVSLEGRLRALALAHDQSLVGAEGGDLTTLIETEMSLHRDARTPERIEISGPRLKLDERAFEVLALVFHEMTTNAVKYGALSVPEGRLSIVWQTTSEGNCELRWSERNGPQVMRPRSAGFGTRLISSAIEYDLRGIAELTYATTGLSARFVIPASHIAPGEAVDAAPERLAVAPGQVLAGQSVLVVEDQGLIAMDAEETLRRLGAIDVRLAPSVDDAIRQLETFAPDAAILDFNLGEETAEAIADELLARGVPFVFTTGYSDPAAIPERFRHIPLIRKPISDASIVSHMSQATNATTKE